MSMPRLLFHLSGLFGEPSMRGLSEDAVLWALEVLTVWDMDWLRTHPEVPKLYDSGVVYALPDQMTSKVSPRDLAKIRRLMISCGASEDSADHAVAVLEGIEVFRDVKAIMEIGSVDCDNLSAWRTAELRLAGLKAAPYITMRETPDGTIYHALVRWPDGTSEDPSLLLGLGGAERAAGRAEERRKNAERYETYVAAGRALFQAGHLSLPEADRQLASLGLLPRTRVGWDTWQEQAAGDRPEARIKLWRRAA